MRRVRRAQIALNTTLAAVLLAGCGNDRTAPPDLGLIAAPKGFRDAVYAEQGLRFRAPTNWRIFPGDSPQVATVASGDGQIGIWRYPRSEPLPETRAQLKAAREALVAQVQRRDPTFKLTSSRLIVKPGLRAVELIGVGSNLTNMTVTRSLRSLHAYGHGAEVVVDAFAPTKEFARVDEQTFGPVSRSLKLRKPAAK